MSTAAASANRSSSFGANRRGWSMGTRLKRRSSTVFPAGRTAGVGLASWRSSERDLSAASSRRRTGARRERSVPAVGGGATPAKVGNRGRGRPDAPPLSRSGVCVGAGTEAPLGATPSNVGIRSRKAGRFDSRFSGIPVGAAGLSVGRFRVTLPSRPQHCRDVRSCQAGASEDGWSRDAGPSEHDKGLISAATARELPLHAPASTWIRREVIWSPHHSPILRRNGPASSPWRAG